MNKKEQRLAEGLLILNKNSMCRKVMDILYDGRTGYDGLSKKIFGENPSEEEEALLGKSIKMLRPEKANRTD